MYTVILRVHGRTVRLVVSELLTFTKIGLLHLMKGAHFFRGLSWLVVLNMLIKPIWIFGIDRQVQNVAGHEAYGTYFSILNLSIILSFFADAGLTNMLNRELALRQLRNIEKLVRIKIVLSLIYLCILFFVAWLTHVHYWQLILLTGLLQIFSSFLIFFRNVITGYQQFGADAWVSVIDKALTILICGSLLYLPFSSGLSLQSFLLIQCGSTLAALIIAVIIVTRHHEPSDETINIKGVFERSAPFILLILLMGVHTRLDAFLLERIHPQGPYQAGVYASAYRLLDAGNTLGYLAASFLLPFVAYNLGDGAIIEATVLKLRHALMTAAAVFIGVCAAFSEKIMNLLYHTPDPYHAKVLLACAAALPAYYLIHLYGSLLNAKGKFRIFSIVVFSCVGLNVIANLVLIPGYGALGCGIAALISQYLCGGLCFIFATKTLKLHLHLSSILVYAVVGMTVYGAGYCWQRYGFSWGSLILAGAILIGLIMFALRKTAKKQNVSL